MGALSSVQPVAKRPRKKTPAAKPPHGTKSAPKKPAPTAVRPKPLKRPTQDRVWSHEARRAHWKKQDLKDGLWLAFFAVIICAPLYVAWKADSKLPKIPEPEAMASPYSTPTGNPLTVREQKQKQALARFAQSREADVLALHKHMIANARAINLEDVLTRLEPYLGSGYGLPKAKTALEKLLESDGAAPLEQKLEAVLALHDSLDSLAGQHYSETSRYARDYFERYDLTKFIFNYRFPDRVFHNDLADTLRAFIKPYSDHVIKVDPRVHMSGTFGAFWQPLRP